jgi:hypothetical protein
MQSYRIPANPIVSMFSTIHDIKYITRKVYRDSDTAFGRKEEFLSKPQGLEQGNGAGPSSWSIASSKMFEVLHSRGCATLFSSPMTKEHINIYGFALVDDSDIIAASGHSHNPTHMLHRMQTAIDCWQGVAKSTGGALEPSKSWLYLLHFKWEQGQWEYEKGIIR